MKKEIFYLLDTLQAEEPCIIWVYKFDGKVIYSGAMEFMIQKYYFEN